MIFREYPDRGAAVFFDFDGTLVDLAAHPGAIRVEPEVPRLVAALAAALDGAVAVVSGRPLAELDRHLQPLVLCAAGVHGVERRAGDGRLEQVAPPELAAAEALARSLQQRHPALGLERKPGALALHYRQAPELAELCLATMTEAQRLAPGTALLHGKMVVELKPAAADKGKAVERFLAEPPFVGRRPWFFGDDVTDESAFDVVQRAGGVAVKVGAGATVAQHRLSDPAALRGWLAEAVDRLAVTP